MLVDLVDILVLLSKHMGFMGCLRDVFTQTPLDLDDVGLDLRLYNSFPISSDYINRGLSRRTRQEQGPRSKSSVLLGNFYVEVSVLGGQVFGDYGRWFDFLYRSREGECDS